MDIRQLYESLSPEDRAQYQIVRTDIRKVYLNAHTNIIGMERWDISDDAFMDLLDIKVAVLFDRAGAIAGEAINKEEEQSLESDVEKQGKKITDKMLTEMSEATKSLRANGATKQW